VSSEDICARSVSLFLLKIELKLPSAPAQRSLDYQKSKCAQNVREKHVELHSDPLHERLVYIIVTLMVVLVCIEEKRQVKHKREH
jgi:hypothetical protein